MGSYMLGLLFRRPIPPVPQHVDDFVEQASRGPIIHRAGVPENTLAAIRSARKEGAIGVEIDVMLTRDERCVLLHDETVDRTARNGSGRVRDMNLEQIGKLDVGNG